MNKKILQALGIIIILTGITIVPILHIFQLDQITSSIPEIKQLNKDNEIMDSLKQGRNVRVGFFLIIGSLIVVFSSKLKEIKTKD